MLKSLKKVSPVFIRSIARKLRINFFSLVDSKKPFLNKTNYQGFNLYYTRGAGLINRIRFGNPVRDYEPDLIEKITTELKKEQQPVFFDIGSNIGLISIGVLKKIPNINIYAFEPSPVAFKSFFTTIFANKLEKKIILSEIAISNENKEIEFATHEDRDSSGDGILDTKRTNKPATTIKIKAKTLDVWWEENNKPKVNVIKIDIEGGLNCIENTKPVIFLEISIENLLSYPYSSVDIYNFFQKNDYELTDTEGEKCTEINISEKIKICDTFIATPKK